MKSLLTLEIFAMAACVTSLCAQTDVAGVNFADPAAPLGGVANNGRRAPSVSVIPLRQFSFNKDLAGDIGLATIAFDGDRVYVSSPDGIVWAADSLASDFNPIFQTPNNGIANIYVYNHVLYVLTAPATAESEGHAMFQSKDKGSSFTTIDDGLQTCVGSVCSYIVASQLFAEADLLYANAGGGPNLQVSRDEGRTWLPLSGVLEGQICYSSPFAIADRTVLQGGECPLDSAFLSRGVLSLSMLFFESNLTPAQTPDITNRKIYGIAVKPGVPVALAGAEGALLRSVDNGRSWKMVIEAQDGSGFYPYVQHILFSSRQSGVVLAGGFDKGAEQNKPFLAWSLRDGAQWTDASSLLGIDEEGSLSDLKEDTYGRLIAVAVDVVAKTVTVSEVRIQR